MKVIKTIFGVLAILIGIVWVLQGSNLFPDSAMSGQNRFLLAGLLAFAGGVVILLDTWRKKPASPSNGGKGQ